jgi:hypothetical protein
MCRWPRLARILQHEASSLAVMFYNFIRTHKTLRMSPAMAAGVSDRLWPIEDLVAAMDAREVPQKRGAYKKRDAEISNSDITRGV